MTSRRNILIASSAGVFLVSVPFPSPASAQGKVWRLGYLGNRVTAASVNHVAFVEAMRDLGYVEGKNLVIERRPAEDRIERLSPLAIDLVKSKVDLIVTTSTQATAAAQKATDKIPIVMVGVGDPVSSGFVKSLARPGGNITGLSSLTPELSQQQLDLLLGVAPTARRVAVLVDPGNSAHVSILKRIRDAARGTNVEIVPVQASSSAEIARAISLASQENGAILVNGALFNGHLPEIAGLARKHKLVSISAFRTFVRAGGLMSYGQNLSDSFRRAVVYVDNVFKGVKPADLPPTRFELPVI